MVGFVQTMPGVGGHEKYSLSHHNVQCFWGEKTAHYDIEQTVSVQQKETGVKVSVITEKNVIAPDNSLAQTESLEV